jgi:hypothetical protein
MKLISEVCNPHSTGLMNVITHGLNPPTKTKYFTFHGFYPLACFVSELTSEIKPFRHFGRIPWTGLIILIFICDSNDVLLSVKLKM